MNIEGSENESEFQCFMQSSNFQTSFNIPNNNNNSNSRSSSSGGSNNKWSK